MSEPAAAPRFTIRSLPLPAKLVITLFMLSVGLGYFSALVQMHFQHTQGDGTAMPGVNDVIEIFAEKRLTREEIEKNRPVSKLEKLVMGPIDGPLTSSGSMGSAFFKNDKSDSDNRYKDAIKKAPVEEVNAQREGERRLITLWVNTPVVARKQAYTDNRFVPPEGKAPAKISPEYVHKDGRGYLIQQIFTDRCATCHQDGNQAGSFPLESYDQIAKYADCGPATVIPAGQDWAWCASDRQIGKEKLAQSTHAHLLSFSMLFALTGLVFSFTSYPGVIRGILGPIVLIAQIADVSCWWLARLDDPGVYFAMAIMGTGAVVGGGLGLQIILSVFNMYGRMGKFVLVLLFVAAGTAGYVVAEKVAIPELREQKSRQEQREAARKLAEEKPEVKAAAKPAPKPIGKVDPRPPMPMGSPTLERLLTGNWEMAPWGPDKATKKVPDRGMVRAFFDKDTDFKDAVKHKKDEPDVFAMMRAQREGEQNVVLAWIKTAPDARKSAYEKDEFPLPPELKGKPMTAEIMANDRAVKIRTVFEIRCYKCHDTGTEVELTSYKALEKYLK